MLLGLATVVGAVIGLALGVSKSDEFFGEIEIVVYGIVGSVIGVGVGIVLYLLTTLR